MLQASEWRILDYLTLSHEGPVFISQIARDIGLSKGAVSKAFVRLGKLGFLDRQLQGKMVFYQVNRRHPVVVHIRIVFNLFEIEPKLLALKKCANKIVLFGSCARGEDSFKSDVDVLIVAKDPGKALKVAGQIKLSRPMQWVVKTPQEYVALNSKEPVFADELSQGIVLWESYETA